MYGYLVRMCVDCWYYFGIVHRKWLRIMQDFLRCKNEPFDSSSVCDFIFYECSFLCAAVEKMRISFLVV